MKLTLSTSPHIRTDDTIPKIMWTVILTLLPASLVGIYLFGIPALEVIIIAMLISMATEALAQKIMDKPLTYLDGSAALTGILLALNLPPSSPWWMVVVGSVISVVVGKQIYGGLGHNPFNPALVGRVVLLISWPVQMTTWHAPAPMFSGLDAVTKATPLGALKTEGVKVLTQFHLADFFVGNTGGCIGEVSVVALLLGAAYLLIKKYISLRCPLSFISTVFIFSGIFWLHDPTVYANPFFHILSGGLFLGAFFMATDYVTTPTTPKGQIVFGVGCGLLTCIIRFWGSFPEGVSFAILFMNACTPLIERYIKPTTFGKTNG
jgi:electron transport complex protein RnfD